ncbi:MAG: adenylosuccinate lyase [bacterium]|nr:adenylosuccinate lyase [bacterium]
MNIFDNISPLDFRYYGKNKAMFSKLEPYLSEKASVKYMLAVEAAMAQALAEKKVCGKDVAKEISDACKKVTVEEVYDEEDRIKHNVRALVNCIRKNVSKKAKPYVHLAATSCDIICTAEAARMRDVANNVVIPEMVALERTLISLTRREKATLQIGRTHGQHAEPITFGFAMAEYVSRFGNRVLEVRKTSNNLRGKISGAVGSYNASALFFENPEEFEGIVLNILGLRASTHSTQIAEPEYMTDYIHSVISAFGVIANLADDMRHLQRSEIAEVAELFGSKQVGSSTMPHKRNPINFENVKSMWKAFMPRMNTVYMDQISEHQRDLTNSASSRFNAEAVAAFVIAINRLNKVMENLVVDKNQLKENFNKNKDMISAEPAYILLAAYGHPDAHEYVRKVTLKAQKEKKSFGELLLKDPSIKQYLNKFTKQQIAIIKNPEKYTGISAKKAEHVCKYWEGLLKK